MRKVSNFKLAATYADAIYSSAEESGCLQEAYRDINALKSLEQQTCELLHKIDNPLVKNAKKEELIRSLAKKLKLHKHILNMLILLARNNKMFLLSHLLERFFCLYNQKNNIAEVIIKTVTKPNKRQEEKLIEKLATIFEKDVSLKYVIDPNIIGGLVIQYNTFLIDTSILYKLNSLEQIMKGNN